MSQSIKNHEATVMRIAGNLLSGRKPQNENSGRDDNHLSTRDVQAVYWAVAMARAIAAEVVRTAGPSDPAKEPKP